MIERAVGIYCDAPSPKHEQTADSEPLGMCGAGVES